MKDILNAVIVAALALVLMRGVGGQMSDGTAVREAYLSQYREELKPAARDFAMRLRSKEFKDSLSAVKALSDGFAAARVRASKSVDERVKELCEAGDVEAAAVFAEEFGK